MVSNKKGLLALSPIAVLLTIYLAGAYFSGDFYRVPITVSFLAAAIYGIFLLKGKCLNDRVKIVSEGASHPDIMYMIWIFCMAGIFAASAKAMGAVDATVALTMKVVPSNFMPAGIFIASCFISMAIGTSVGTIVALTPMVTVMAPQIGCETAWLVAVVVGGAFFGDNLSFISDTTIAATQSQGCKMSDKFKTNFLIVLPAAIATLCIYIFGGQFGGYAATQDIHEWYKALPYLMVIILALSGMNVLMVLLLGILATNIMGLICGSMDCLTIFTAMGDGLGSMMELILVTMLAGGVMNIIRQAGGFDYLIRVLTRGVNSKRGAEGIVALLTAFTNFCTANNTIAILTVGSIARDLSKKYSISPRKTASIMDTASCFVQGIIPYGAQLLMASGLAAVSPIEIIPNLYYPMGIGVMLLLAILFRFPKL
jgi:Na+/H+ antiporter NhaC